MTLERRAQALLDIVENDRSAQCEAILAEARGRASALVAQAHADARTRMREAFAEERRRLHERVSAARAKLQTRQRLHEQQRTAALLALGLAAASRRAASTLARQRHAPRVGRRGRRHGLARAAARAVAHRARSRLAGRRAAGARRAHRDGISTRRPRSIADAGIDAGLRIASGGNVVDGSLGGLLADRVEVGNSADLEQA